MKYAGACIVFFVAIVISYVAGVGHGANHHAPTPKQACGVPVYRGFMGTVEHTVFRGHLGKRAGMHDIVFRNGLGGGALYSSFLIDNNGYQITMFYPDTVCLEAPNETP